METSCGTQTTPIVGIVRFGDRAFREDADDAARLSGIPILAGRWTWPAAHLSVGSVARTNSAGLVVGTPP